MSILYVILKLLAYCFWCGFGIFYLQLAYHPLIGWAMFFGTIRLLMGLIFGIAIWIVGTLAYVGYQFILSSQSHELSYQILTYLSVYIPIRWIEWSLLETIMNPNSRTFNYFLVGNNSKSRYWRAGGILVSCLADIPIIISVGSLSIGRFMC